MCWPLYKLSLSLSLFYILYDSNLVATLSSFLTGRGHRPTFFLFPKRKIGIFLSKFSLFHMSVMGYTNDALCILYTVCAPTLFHSVQQIDDESNHLLFVIIDLSDPLGFCCHTSNLMCKYIKGRKNNNNTKYKEKNSEIKNADGIFTFFFFLRDEINTEICSH